MDLEEEAKARFELAKRFFEEGKKLIDEDPVQASEKSYRVAEGCVKALVIRFRFEDILKSVRSRGR